VSQFYEKGQLTPDEFITAGDQLVKACKNWSWKPAANEKLKTTVFPPEKQYLYCEARSLRRIKETVEICSKEKEV